MTEQEYQAQIADLKSQLAAASCGKISITQIGVHTPRNGAGEFMPEKSFNIYALTKDLQALGVAPVLENDKTHTDVAGLFCKKQRAYVQAVKNAETENATRPRVIPPCMETPEDLAVAELAAIEERALEKIRKALRGAGLNDD